jgi:ABC-2 type transport system permease protein
MDIVGLLCGVSLFFFIARYTGARAESGRVDFFAFAVPGIAILRMQFGVLRSIASLDREQASGTLELLFAAPSRPSTLISGSAMYEVLRGAFLAVVVLAAGRWIFGARLTLGPRAWAGLVIGLIAATLFFVALSNATAGVLIAFKYGVPLANLLGLILPIVSGAYFSTTALPETLRHVTEIVPLTLAINVTRDAVLSAHFAWGESLFALLAASLCIPVSMYLVELAVRRSRRLGTLGQY